MSKKVPPSTKPVNDLIRFWAAQQEEKEKATLESRSPRRPLSPNTSTPPSPRAYSPQPYSPQPLSPTKQWNFRDTPTTSPPLSPTINNINRSITDISNRTIQTSIVEDNNNKSVDTLISHVTSAFLDSQESSLRPGPRDALSKVKSASQMVQRDSLPMVKNVSSLVSKFEKVVSPPTSPTTLAPPVKRSQSTFPESSQPTSPTSPKAISPLRRNQTIEPLSISQPLSDAISDTLVSQIKQRDNNPLELSISTSLKESSTTQNQQIPPEPLYSPIRSSIRSSMSMKRRSNIPDPIIIPSPTTSTNSIKETKETKEIKEVEEAEIKEARLVKVVREAEVRDAKEVKEVKVKEAKEVKEVKVEEAKEVKEVKVKEVKEVKEVKVKETKDVKDVKDVKVKETKDVKDVKETKLLNDEPQFIKASSNSEKKRAIEEPEKLTSSISSSIKSIVSPTIKSKLRSDSKPKSDIPKSKIESKPKSETPNPDLPKPRPTENLPQIRPTSSFDIDFLGPIFDQSNSSFGQYAKGEGSSVSEKSFIPNPTSSFSKSVSTSFERELVQSKDVVSPISKSKSSSNLPIPETTGTLPRVSLSSPDGQETTAEVLSSPPALSPNSGSTPVGSMPTSPEFVSSKFSLDLLPEITPISPFWNPAAANSTTGSNTVSPLWKPLPENQNRPISPVLMPEPDNSLSQKIATLKNDTSLTDGNNKPPDLWFKRSSNPSFLKVPELLPKQSYQSEPASKSSESDPIANSYIFSFLSDDTDSWKFFAESPNNSSTKLKLDLNPFSSYLDNIKEDNDATDVENEDQNYNPFVDKEQSNLAGEKNTSEDEIANSHTIEMQVTNISHSRSTTKVDDENDPDGELDNSENPDLKNSGGNYVMSIPQTDNESRRPSTINRRSEQQSRSVDGEYDGLKKLGSIRSIRSLDSVTKFKQRRHRSQRKYKPVQISKYPYSTTHPQRYTLSPGFTLKDKQYLSVSVKYNADFTRLSTIMNDGKENAQEIGTLDISVVESVDIVDTKFTINPFDELEKNKHFLPGTPWICLPHLDEYIQSFPKTQFTNPKNVMTSEEYGKFMMREKHLENSFPFISQSLDNSRTSQVKGEDDENDNRPTERGIAGPSPSSGKCQEAISILYEQRFLKLEIIRDFIQLMAIALTFVTPGMFNNNWIYIMLSSITNFLSFNWDEVFGFGAMFLVMFCIIGFGSSFLFRKIANWKKVTDVENHESSSCASSSLLQSHIIIFILTTLYVPLTKLSLDALVWSDNFWPVENPYLPNVDFPDFNSMVEAGNGDLRFPKDFCYVTSMKKGEFNFSPFIIILAILNLSVITFWFPFSLKRMMNTNMGRFDNEGSKRNEIGEVDNYPYKFLYNGYNENWGTYKSYIMAVKFLLIFLIVVISKDNCLFRSVARQQTSTITQSLQIVLFTLLFISQWKGELFIYSNFNTAEYWARFAYWIASIIGMIIIQAGPMQGFGIGLLLINITIFIVIIRCLSKDIDEFSEIDMGGDGAYGSRSVGSIRRSFGMKKLEFSLDISSPSLDFDRLIKERIWQDTWAKLLLTNDKYRPPTPSAENELLFSEASFRAPYLLNFSESVGERHIENTKILSAIGLQSYVQSLTPLSSSLNSTRSKILNSYVGVDMYYSEKFLEVSKKTYFGKAYVVPFPFCVVLCYDDDDSIVVLTQEQEIQKYLQQNENKEIQRRRLIRRKIRALEGKNIIGPCYEKADNTKNKVHYHQGVLSIQRKQGSLWRDHDLNSGFKVTITYNAPNDKCPRVVGHDIIGITEDFKMTHNLEKLFRDNYELVEMGLDKIQTIMDEHRQFYQNESISKEATLTYGFHINIFNNPAIPLEILPSLLINTEENKLVRSIPEQEYPTIIYLYERMRIVHTSRVHQWWYLFWEDLWKNNENQIQSLRKYEQDFSPLYRTSICYQPMKRLDLEEFMEKRGLWLNNGKYGLFHSGLLNRIYLYLNEAVFSRKGKDGMLKKWYISNENKKQDCYDENNNFIDKVGIIKSVIRNSHNNNNNYYIMREEDSDSEFEDVELDTTNNNNVSDDETLCY